MKENKIKTIVIKNPTEKLKRFFERIQANKKRKREKLLKKEEHTFKIYI